MASPPSSDAVHADNRDTRSAQSSRALIALWWTLSFLLLAIFLYFLGLHSHWGNADLVRGLLQGSDMAKGNVLLRHWYSGADNFLTIDLVFFAVGVLLIGAKVALLHYVSAVVWAGLAVAAVYMATIDLRGWPRCVAITVVAGVLCLPCPVLAQQLSQSLTHVGTALFVLLAFIALRNSRFGPGWVVAVVLLTACAFGDPLAIAFAIVPVFAVGVLESIRQRNVRSGIAISSAPVIAAVGAALFRLVTDKIGTFKISSTAPLASPSQMNQNFHTVFSNFISLFGLGGSLSSSGVPWELEVVRALSLAVALVGLLVGLGCLLIGVVSGQPRVGLQGMAGRTEASFRLSDFLALAVIGDFACYVLLSLPGSGQRYLVPGVVFASVLGAMFIGQFARQLSDRRIQGLVVAVALALACCCTASVAVILAQPEPVSPYSGLVSFLESHHLFRGVGDYWTSSPVTVYSNGRVIVRQVVPSNSGGLAPYLVLSDTQWYEGKFQFLVYNFDESAYGVPQSYGIQIREGSKFPFFPVAHSYRYHSFRIIVWKTPERMKGGMT